MESSTKSKIAETRPRNAQGQFLKPSPPAKLINSLFSKDVNANPTMAEDQTLIDVHVNNPLHKIVEILQEIKNQKAFSFNLRGSIGLVGAVAALTLTGVFGSNKILCNKGTQSLVGTVKVLQVADSSVTNYPLRNKIRAVFGQPPLVQTSKKRVILINSATTVLLISGPQITADDFANKSVVATGQYNACNQELTLAADGLEPNNQ